ncbi:conserved Plasmodium protein, unknown function [Plasmodium gallinaceum]|uniref:Uncharacterized protein n=1 Tax=Plasmodium gallinaceum TaxID=5849 RepID=A0A1J1GRD4_PLAGA|nr:conserved Plasmodium protein, unknown function [Plasmodium gallinaceum]CRG95095.1 conserved Plasmodium protein, unknown function [Plasmodium gallinaceum]
MMLIKKPFLKWNNIFSILYISKKNYYNIKTISGNFYRFNKRYILTSREESHLKECNKNLYEEELNSVFKQYPVYKKKNEKNEEILITNENNKDKKIGDIIKLDNYIYGVVLQINKNNIVIGKINEQEEKNTNKKLTDVNKKNIYTPFEYVDYLFQKNSKLNIFNSNRKEIYKKVIKKQLYSDILLIDFFNKINYGQKVCVIGEKELGKKKILISIMYENLLVNSIKKNENFFIICSNSYKCEVINIFSHLNELFRNTYKNIGENNNDTENQIENIYSKNYIYENIKIPDDVLLINSTPNNDSKISSYILPLLSLYNLNEYEKKYKNVILIFYDINNYNNIYLELQNQMNTFMKNYYHKNEEINKSKSLYIASLPFSIQTILSKYFSSSVYPYYKQKDNNSQKQDNSNNIKFSLENFKFSDLLNINEDKNYNISNSVTTFCFFDDDEKINQIKNYALSLSENNIYLKKNNLNIYPEINVNYFIKNDIVENNKIWRIIKNEIRNIFDKRNELFELIENKKMMKIYIDHWEYEDFIHYNNIYYILIYKNFKIFNLNSFENLVFLRNLLTYNFTNEIISQKSIELFYDQFFNYYFKNLKYFSFLYTEYYKNIKSFYQIKNAVIFLNKIDEVIKNIKPPFNYIL